MAKIKNKVITFIVLGLVAILSATTGLMLTGSSNDNVVAEATYNTHGLSVKEGASVRTTIDSMGIRFVADYDAATASSLVTVNNNIISIKQGVRLGMIIAPEKALDVTNERVSSILNGENGSNYITNNGQTNYYTLLNAAFGMPVSSYAVDFTPGNLTSMQDGSLTGNAAIVNIQDGNLIHAYKGVAYYYTESTGYVYSDLNDGYKIGEVVDAFFRSYEVDEDVVPGLRQIVAKSKAMEINGNTNDVVVGEDGIVTTPAKLAEGIDMKIGQAFDVEPLLSEGDTYEYSNWTENVNYDENFNTVTANGKGSVDVTVSTPYGVNLVYTVENEKMLDIATGGVSDYKVFSTVGKGTGLRSTTYCTYYGYNLGNYYNGTDHVILNVELGNTVGWMIPVSNMPTEYSPEDKYIVFGYNAYAELAGVENYVDPDNDSAYKIIVKDNSIFVLGHENSLRFGVYGLLNKLIGYEKYAHKGTNVSSEIAFEDTDNVSLGVSQIYTEYNPEIPYNVGFIQGNVYTSSMYSTLFSNASMGMAFGHDLGSGDAVNDDGKTASLRYHITGGHNSFGFYPKYTYYNQTDNPSTYKPNWYAKGEGGALLESPSQVCYYGLRTDPDALEVAFQVALEKTTRVDEKGNPIPWRTIEISNMDAKGDCLCDECKNDWAYEYFMFLNAFADKLATNDATKDMEVQGMLYKDNSTTPPLDASGNPRVVLRDNVSLTFAFDYADYYAGFSDTDIALLENWNKVCKNFNFWTYCFKPSYSMFFFDDFTNKQKLYENLVRFGALSVRDEGDKGVAAGTNFYQLRVWLSKNLAINSGINMTDEEASAYYEQLTQTFFDNYFGTASPYMRAVFEKQKERAQYMYNNWNSGENIYKQAYVDNGYIARLQELVNKGSYGASWLEGLTPTNELGNNRMGTYSSWTYHTTGTSLSGGGTVYGNRLAFALTYSREDFRELVSNCYAAIDAINDDSSIDFERKQELISRVELEMVGILYQFMWTYDNDFAAHGGLYDSSLNAEDLAALRINDIEGGMNLFARLCTKYGINRANYTSIYQLVKHWGIKDGIIEDTEEWVENV